MIVEEPGTTRGKLLVTDADYEEHDAERVTPGYVVDGSDVVYLTGRVFAGSWYPDDEGWRIASCTSPEAAEAAARLLRLGDALPYNPAWKPQYPPIECSKCGQLTI